MSQDDELAKIKERIRKLAAKTIDAGCTEGEANAAMSKVGELLELYNLSMTEVQVGSENCIEIKIEAGTKHCSTHSEWVFSLGAFCATKNWYCKGPNGIIFHFFGLESDVQMVDYLYKVIDRAIEVETQRFKGTPEYRFATTHRKRLSTSFQNAMARRIGQRLRIMTREAEVKRTQAATSTSTSLVIIAKEKRVEAEYLKKGMKLRIVRTPTRISSGVGAQAGYAAGDKVNLSRPLENNGRNALIK